MSNTNGKKARSRGGTRASIKRQYCRAKHPKGL